MCRSSCKILLSFYTRDFHRYTSTYAYFTLLLYENTKYIFIYDVKLWTAACRLGMLINIIHFWPIYYPTIVYIRSYDIWPAETGTPLT